MRTLRTRTATNSRRPHRAKTEDPTVVTFDEHAGLTKDQIQKASALTVIAQNGLRVPFGELIKERKTIVIFIRHFWCASCQDYMYSISRNVNSEALKRAGVDLVIIGNGSPGMIKSYRNIFRTPFPLYTDPTLRLYAALGMTLRTNNPGPDAEKGEYVRHGLIGGIAMVVRNALRVGMPVWERGGDSTQLGGEFVLGPGFNCTYAHRMTTTRSHAPIREVLRAAGYNRAATTPGAGPDGLSLTQDEEEAWMRDRRRSLARMRARREKRRELGTPAEPDVYGPELGYGSDTGSESVSVNGSWASTAEKHQLQVQVAQQREREREREQQRARMKQKRQRRSLQVANPDDHLDHRDHRTHHTGSRTHVPRSEGGRDEWSGGKMMPVDYLNRHGRREDGYDTEDAVTYTR
ncbi:hypothetical protein DICSQDRAFT_52225 [Dichomitus squalens LYAD-421 SS1]|uniref:uncharacterized protein n=1 Tax=Dichomitus squalens (strain LYAD-421) TaxID=732165 RepID=UPI0004411810|nr:uncharacterized protein DICSQDRAFT_52225 [Dichomitus squalens LYAD-421 SS1]EJF64769.1 hypothetical protein DICSQDRAFT_52225 [Dichomitus squalens LYAD-421 SS1]